MTPKVLRFLRSAPSPVGRARATAVAELTANRAPIGRVGPATPSPARVGRTAGLARVTLATAVELPGLPPPAFAAVEIVWPGGDAASIAPSDEDGSVTVAVDEVVVRGAEALDARWAAGSERYKMMSFGRRNPALTRDEFVERWRAEAGRLGGDRIPDDLRGLAYVQDHPRGDDPPFDAINEVWFDRLDDLRRRAEWFAARPVPADLMSPTECWSLYLRETVVVPPHP